MTPFVEALLGQEHTEASWREAFAASAPHTAMGPLGIELVSVDADHLCLAMPITPAARQPFGLLHGGVSILLAETAASFHACWGIDLGEQAPVGIEVSASHVRSIREGRVEAEARVVNAGRTLIHHEVRIREASTAKLLSIVRVTNLYRPHRPPPRDV